MFKKILLYFLLMLCSGCSPVLLPVSGRETAGKIIPIYLDKNFVGEEVQQIELSINDWNNSFNGRIILYETDINFDMSDYKIKQAEMSGGFIILKINSSYVVENTDFGSNILAYVNKIGGTTAYLVRDRLGNKDIRYIMDHEFGHLMGAQHTSDGLMYAYYNGTNYRCIDYTVAKQVAFYESINLEKMNYCK